VPEAPGRFIDAEPFRGPAAGSWKLLYTVPSYPSEAHVMLSVHVCNGKGADAHISLWIIPETDGSGWTDNSGVPPGYTVVCEKIRVESDGTDGNIWGSPVLYLNPGDRLVGFTDLVGVTFYPHGIGAT
jgi:hypothetical protein